jgi:sugar phosphate isomerase/epimerase
MSNPIGLNVHSRRIDGDIDRLQRDLEAIQEAGFDAAEIPVHGVDAIVNGELREKRVSQVRQILSGFELKYSVHAPDRLNLRDFEHPEVHRRVFSAAVGFTAAIGAKTLVYHYGSLMGRNGSLTEAEAREIEVDDLVDLARLATSEGVTICIENIDTSLIHLSKLVESVSEESVKLCCDVSHSYLNATILGYDFLRAIRVAKPLTQHVHVNDNFGRGKPGVVPPYIEAMPLGIGDLHLPVGWGTIPYADVVRILRGYEGMYVLELHERFFANGYEIAKENLAELKALLEGVEESPPQQSSS